MTSSARFLLSATLALAAFIGAASAQMITEFPLPTATSLPGDITAGSDGNLWFTTVTPKIGRITPIGVITEFAVPVFPFQITAGPDGNLWFTEPTANRIGRITPAGVVTEFPIPTPSSHPEGIVAGPDGNLWFTEPTANRIGRITPAGVVTEFPIPTPSSQPEGIVAGSDGNLWFTEFFGDKIGRITTSGVVTEFPLLSNSRPEAIAAGPDGNLWFTYYEGSTINRITTSGVITEFPVKEDSWPADLTAGPDGNLWFTPGIGNFIGRITTAGVVTEFPIPTPESAPSGITPGPDDALWFTELTGNKIGRITTGIVADPTQILPVVGSTAGVAGSFFRTSVQLHNAGTTPSSGGIVFHSSGAPGSIGDPTLFFTLNPSETRTIADLLPEIGLSGLGSADVILTVGSAGNIPIVSARVFNDAGAAGTTGFALNALTTNEALQPGRRGILTIPADLTDFRMNIGIRTLDAAVSLTLTVRDAAGAIGAVVPKFFPAVYHEQQSATAFLNGLPLPPGGSITALIESGSAILYGATVDNRTGDPSLQVARAAP